jgi:predicted dehydrogenase
MNVALLGCGKAGRVMLDELMKNPLIQSVQIYDPEFNDIKGDYITTDKDIKFFGKFNGFKSGINLAVIATPDHIHTDYVLEAIQLGVHCFVEKPFVTNYKDLVKLKSAVNSNPSARMTSNLILRASPLFRKVERAFREKAFGSNVFIEGKYLYGRWEKLVNGWRGNSEYSVILGGLIHLVDLLCFITNEYDYDHTIEYRRITTNKPNNVNDFGSMTFSKADIGVAHLTTNFSTPIEHRRDFSIYGDQGWIEVKGDLISTGGKIAELNLEHLSAKAISKGELLHSFILDISVSSEGSSLYPTKDEVFKVLELCLIQKSN